MKAVYFKSASTPFAKDALHLAMEKLFEKVNVVEKRDIVAIKLHMGELGNTGYIRPIFVRKIVEMVKKQGAKPFITDTTTLYGGHRNNAIDYLHTAAINGFNMASMGCPIIIADGLLGNDYISVEVDGNKINVASAIYEADCLIVMSHFKGHGMSGFGGAIKNLGMGCTSKAGKAWQHAKSKPSFNEEKCIECLKCIKFCPAHAIEYEDKIKIDYEKCYGCGACTVLCEQGCFYINNGNEFQERIVISAKAVLKKFEDKVSFFNFLMDITPRCDCCSFADKPLINDIGIVASNDAVAIDKASYDLIYSYAGKDIFYEEHGIDGLAQINIGEKIGLGDKEYELLEI